MIDPTANLPKGVVIRPSARQLLGQLGPGEKALIAELLERMVQSARTHGVPISKTELIAGRQQEEDTPRLEVRQWVDLPRGTAIDHWSKMGEELDDWVNQLPDPDAETIMEWVAFTVYSSVDDAAA